MTEGKKCTVCGEITVAQEEIVALGHTEAEAAVENFVDSTLNSKGSYDSVVYCSVCKAELKRETIIIDEKPGAVAEIDGYKYATLQEAVNVGGEVKLLDDVVLEETVTVAADKTVILNLNGKTIYAGWDDESAGKHIYAFTNNGELTITGNGVINARGIFNYGSLTLESGTINAIDCNGGYAVRNYEGAAFTMNGGTVATTYEDGDEPGSGSDATTIRVDAGATAVINGGVINNISNYTFAIDNHGTTTVKGGEITAIHTTVANYGTLTIEDGEFTNNGIEGKTQHVIWAAGGVTTIKGGTFDGKDNFNGFNVNTAEGAKVEIMGGTFLPVHSGSLYGEGTIEVSGGTFFDKIPEERCAEGFIPTANEDGTYGVKEGKFVAEVNGTKYETLQEAVNAGGEVTLLTDIVLDAPIVIESGKVVTLDLGEFDITYTSDVAGEAMITNKGTLTIIGKGEIVYTYTGEADTAYTKGNYTITNSSTLTIDDACTIKNATAKMSHASYAINNGNGGTVVINDGLVVNETNYAIRQFSAGSITVNGGEVRGTRAVWMQAAGSNAANAPVMSLTVNDGKLVGTGESATYKLAVYSYSYGDSMKNVSITVTGGEIEGDIALTGGKNKTDAETVTVTGGTVTDLYSYATDEVAEKTINISGGTFEVAIYEAYCAEGFIPTANEDGTYGVKEGKFVAEVNGTKYETLQEAVNVGGEVKLLDDVVLEETLVIEAGKTVVLDLNGKSISQVKACTGNYNMIYNKGNLTITGNGKISFTDIGAGDPKFGWGSYTIRNEGTLVVENGTIENLSAQNPDPASGKVVHMYCAIFQYSGSTTINGGKISTPTYRSVRLWKGEMTINGGEFEGQVWIQAVDSTAKMTITGGTFAPRGVDGSSVFVGNIDNSGKLHVVDLKVTGGTFTTKIGANDVASLNGPITGGTFTAAAMQYTNADLINSEYEFTQNADGSYGVELHIHTEKTTVETVDATCTTAGYTKTTVICETCGETISETVEEIAALGHTEEIIPGKAATCTETGLTEGKKCTVCGEVLTAQEVIPATGHEYDENGTDTDCNICGAARPTVIVDGNTVSVQLNGVEIVKTHTFYVEGKNVDINNWAELKATGTLKSFKTSEFVLADAGAYVLRVEYLDKDGVRQAVSYTAEIATSLVPASKPEFVVKDNIVSVKANGATNIKVYAFYVEGKEVADINYWEALKAADPNFKTYSKGVIPLTKVGKYVLRAEYLDANGVKNVESFEVNIASVPVSLTVLENRSPKSRVSIVTF